ncbi:UNVERIFIED_CONTAM: dipeptide transport system substrate-binding protein [Brevibacillus sp. OAP136]|nr:peptide ABC transporter substrate-binding protein [Brevibacillus fluminis]
MKKRSSIMLSVSLAASMLAVGCSSNEPAQNNQAAPAPSDSSKETPTPQDQHSKLLLLNNLKEPTSLDPPIGFDQISYDILNNMMEGMTRLGKDNNPEPAAAKEWKISEDGKTYTFLLRDGIKWSNGDPVTAQDFEFAWKRLLDPQTASPAAFLGYVFEGGEAFGNGKGKAEDVKIKALDDKTLEVKLAYPAPYLIHMVSNPAFFPVHKATVEKDPKWAADAKTILSNGPFKLTEWTHDSEVKMVKNENYWDAANVKLDGVTWKMIDDENTEYQMYQNEELHTSGVPADMADQLFKDNKVTVADSAGTSFYRFNVTKEPFDNVNIRKAFSMAIDRQTLVDYVLQVKQKPAFAFVSPGMADPAGGDFREVGGDYVKFDAAEAKKLLEQGMKEKGYKQLPEVTMSYSSGTTNEKVAQALQEMFKQNIGVDVKMQKMESKVLTAEQKKLQLQLSRSSFLPDFGDPINFIDGFQTGNPMNRTGWSNPKFDKLIKDAYNQPDNKKRFELMHEAEKTLFEDAPIAPLYFYNSTYLQSDKVEGIVRHALGYMDLKWADLK